jgi:hypothetical protein
LFVGPIILAVAWQLMMAWIRDEKAEAVPSEVDHTTAKVAAED